jgi:hypothetical protein
MPPEGKPHNQIDHILVGRRRHSNVLDVQSFRVADCDTDHYLVVAKVRERLAVNKQRSTALENVDAEVEINSAWEITTENIKISAKERLGYFQLKRHKPWFNKDAQNY